MVDLHTAYSWLIQFEGSSISTDVNDALQRRMRHSAVNDRLQTIFLDGGLRVYLKHKGSKWEEGEVWVVNAVVAFEMGRRRRAIYFLERALSAYSGSKHSQSIILWMLGYVYWHLPGQSVRGGHYCRWSLELFKDLAYQLTGTDPRWHQEKYSEMLRIHYWSVRKNEYVSEPPAPVRVFLQRPRSAPAAQPSPPELPAPPTAEAGWPVYRSVKTYPVYQSVPAGGWGAVGQDEIGRVEVENFVIDGVPHRAQNLQGPGDVKVREGFDYAVVKIWGHSMRLSNIHDGDYVLVRVQEAASHGDIALVVKHGADTEATLKGYLERNPGEVLLIPHSDQLDPKTGEPYAPVPIGEKDGVRVFGIAMAVFKPI